MQLKRIQTFLKDEFISICKFIALLTEGKDTLSENTFRMVLNSNNTHLFILYSDKGEAVGMITIVDSVVSSGHKAWIEDVVVDSAHRGKGYGKRLVEYAIEYAKKMGVETLMLTSNPKRIEANKLYQSLSFEQYTTNVYKLRLT